MNTMTDSRDTILKLKEVREQRGLSLNDIVRMCEEKGYYISKTTVSRLFAEGSEDVKFRYEDTIRPIANALLDIETIEDTDELDVKAMKSLLKLKMNRIEELEHQLEKEKLKHHEKMEKEREQFRKSLDFLREQVSYKDKRIDTLMESVQGFTNHILNCPYRKKEE